MHGSELTEPSFKYEKWMSVLTTVLMRKALEAIQVMCVTYLDICSGSALGPELGCLRTILSCNEIIHPLSALVSTVCYSLSVWAVYWLPLPPALLQLQLEEVKVSQGWCRSLQGSLCPQCLLSLLHLDLARKEQIQIPRSQTQAHMRNATANVKVRNCIGLIQITHKSQLM